MDISFVCWMKPTRGKLA